ARVRTVTYTLSLHDALPILWSALEQGSDPQGGDGVARGGIHGLRLPRRARDRQCRGAARHRSDAAAGGTARALRTPCDPPLRQRSEEHTSELQSRENLVCRL